MAKEKKYLVTLATAQRWCELIEKELEKGNPLNTPELWNEFIMRASEEGAVTPLGVTGMDAELLAANLRESNFRAKVLKSEKDKK